MSSPAHNYGDPTVPPHLCQNCSVRLRGPYCWNCGQHDVDYHRSFHHLTHDLLENLFHFDGKFLVSVAWLLAKPGRMTVEFNAGRRASQVPPLRFYIFVTVLFFLGVHLLNHGHLFPIDRQTVSKVGGAFVKFQPPSDFSRPQKARFGELVEQALSDQRGPDSQATLSEAKREEIVAQIRAEAPPAKQPRRGYISIDEDSDLGREFSRKVKSGELTLGSFIDGIESRVPTLLFLGMPVFALFLKLLYFRSKKYYVEHLIFSLHLHTWAFLAFMIGSGYFRLATLGPRWLPVVMGWALGLWMLWYVLAAFRTVYAQGWRWTIFKLGVIAVGYVVALSYLMVGLIYLTILLMVG